jgi:putative transposase
VRRAYKYRLRPTAAQHGRLHQCLRSHRQLYNAALEERREAWRMHRVNVSYGMQSAQLSAVRAGPEDAAQWSFSSQQATLRRLNWAMAAFFRRVKEGGPPGFPRFKGADRFDSVEWPKDGDGCRWKPEAHRVYLQGIGAVRVHLHRPAEGCVKTITVKRDGRHWYLILSCDEVPARPLPATGAGVGVDVGVTTFLATSDGSFVDNPRHGRRGAVRLARAQAVVAGKQRGSGNRRAARAVVANRHRKVTNQRKDFHHKAALELVRAYDVIVVEDLAVKNMTRSAGGTVAAPGRKVAQKAGLNHSILDAGWAQFRSVLSGKAEDAGRTLIAVNPQHTSQRCAACGHVEAGNREGIAFRCRACGHMAHADTNAAINILGAGLALLATLESSAA